MSVFNGSKYLKQSIDSILAQTCQDFEFIIIDDSSTDDSASIVLSYKNDKIRLVKNEVNLGLAASLNKGILLAQGKYIARMDDDDIAYPERFAKQLAFLEENPSVGVLGTYAKFIGDRSGTRKHSSNNDELKVRSLFSCQFCHPTVMMRKAILLDSGILYNEDFKTAQDYELWSRLLKHTNFASLPEILLDYRFHSKQLSAEKRDLQLQNTYKIYDSFYKALKLVYSEDEMQLHKELADFNFDKKGVDLAKTATLFRKFISANEERQLFNQAYFSKFLSEYMYNLLRSSSLSWKQKYFLYFSNKFDLYFKPKFIKIKLFLKPQL